MENKDNHTIMPSDIDAIEDDPLFSDLQALWDEQAAFIDRALAQSDATPGYTPAKVPHPSAPLRLRMLAAYVVLSVVAVASAVYWGILIPSLAYTTLALVVSLTIEAIYILLAAECLCQTVSLIVFRPDRVGILRMSRYIRRSHMLPNYAPDPLRQPQSPQVIPNQGPHATPSQGQSIGIIPMQRMRRAAAASIAAVIALTVVSSTVTGTDGYLITQDHPGRAASIEIVNNVIRQL